MQLPSSLFSESPFLSAQKFFLFFALCFQLVPGEYLSGNAKNSTSNLSHEKLAELVFRPKLSPFIGIGLNVLLLTTPHRKRVCQLPSGVQT
jgi:hypothetical protein